MTIYQWGNSNEEKYFAYMQSYSPYDNVMAQDYPAMFVTAGLNDPRVGMVLMHTVGVYVCLYVCMRSVL